MAFATYFVFSDPMLNCFHAPRGLLPSQLTATITWCTGETVEMTFDFSHGEAFRDVYVCALRQLVLRIQLVIVSSHVGLQGAGDIPAEIELTAADAGAPAHAVCGCFRIHVRGCTYQLCLMHVLQAPPPAAQLQCLSVGVPLADDTSVGRRRTSRRARERRGAGPGQRSARSKPRPMRSEAARMHIANLTAYLISFKRAARTSMQRHADITNSLEHSAVCHAAPRGKRTSPASRSAPSQPSARMSWGT